MARKEIDVMRHEQGRPISIPELGTGGEVVEIERGFEIKDAVELEKFMNEILVIMVFEDNRDGALRIISPTVNQKRQPILRGAKQKVRRKYVEALARSVFTSFDQRKEDPFDPSSLVMVPTTRQSYPFTVIHDPNPNGAAWLEGILQQKA